VNAARRLLAAAGLVAVGWLVTPQPVPVYDGIGVPDEPYRYVARPQGATSTAGPTSAFGQTPVKGGVSTNGLSIATREVGPQFSLFLPPMAMAAGGTVEVRAVPEAPTDQPPGASIDGNVYVVSISSKSGPVTLTAKAGLSSMYLRATTTRQPPPAMQFRAEASQPWKALATSRNGQDVYVASFPGPGQFALAFSKNTTKGSSPLPLVLLGASVLLVALVVVIRLRTPSE